MFQLIFIWTSLKAAVKVRRAGSRRGWRSVLETQLRPASVEPGPVFQPLSSCRAVGFLWLIAVLIESKQLTDHWNTLVALPNWLLTDQSNLFMTCWTWEGLLAFWGISAWLRTLLMFYVSLFGDGCYVSWDLWLNTPGILFTLASWGFFFLFLFKIPGWIIHHYLESGSLSSSHLYSTKVSTAQFCKILD